MDGVALPRGLGALILYLYILGRDKIFCLNASVENLKEIKLTIMHANTNEGKLQKYYS